MQVTKEYARSVYNALMLCYEMWDELAGMESGRRGNGWAGDKLNTRAFSRTKIYCAACEHAKYFGFPCNKCIMIELWPNECCADNSPYASWDFCKGTSSDARKIANFAKNKAKRIAKKWGFE